MTNIDNETIKFSDSVHNKLLIYEASIVKLKSYKQKDTLVP